MVDEGIKGELKRSELWVHRANTIYVKPNGEVFINDMFKKFHVEVGRSWRLEETHGYTTDQRKVLALEEDKFI